MKTFLKRKVGAYSLIELLIVIAIMAILAAFILPQAHRANAQVTPQTLTAVSGIPTNIAAGATSNNIVAPIVLRNNKGCSIAWTYNGCTNATLTVTASNDGTNYFPFATLAQTNSLASTTTTNYVTLGTNWSAAQLAGLYSLNISSMANAGSIATTNKTPSAPVLANIPNT